MLFLFAIRSALVLHLLYNVNDILSKVTFSTQQKSFIDCQFCRSKLIFVFLFILSTFYVSLSPRHSDM